MYPAIQSRFVVHPRRGAVGEWHHVNRFADDHGGVLDMLWRRAHGLPLHGPRECAIPNTGINRLRWADGRLQIVRWAQADHLDGLPEQPSTAQSRHPPDMEPSKASQGLPRVP